jgi:hypothetical protein
LDALGIELMMLIQCAQMPAPKAKPVTSEVLNDTSNNLVGLYFPTAAVELLIMPSLPPAHAECEAIRAKELCKQVQRQVLLDLKACNLIV